MLLSPPWFPIIRPSGSRRSYNGYRRRNGERRIIDGKRRMPNGWRLHAGWRRRGDVRGNR